MIWLDYRPSGRDDSKKLVFSYAIGCKKLGSILYSVPQEKRIGYDGIKHDKARN